MMRLVLCVFTALLITACEAKVEGPKLKLSVPTLDIAPHGKFCPPGQAKKGRC